jgi:hypothetical protein
MNLAKMSALFATAKPTTRPDDFFNLVLSFFGNRQTEYLEGRFLGGIIYSLFGCYSPNNYR